MNRLNEEQIKEEVIKTGDLIYQEIGIKPTLFRPPGGVFNERVVNLTTELGYMTVMWSWHQDTRDWDTDTIAYVEWPKYDENWLVENEVEIVVQINGKVKAKLVIPADADREQMQELALEDEQVKAAMDGKSVRKVIAVPGKLVNIVVG